MNKKADLPLLSPSNLDFGWNVLCVLCSISVWDLLAGALLEHIDEFTCLFSRTHCLQDVPVVPDFLSGHLLSSGTSVGLGGNFLSIDIFCILHPTLALFSQSILLLLLNFLQHVVLFDRELDLQLVQQVVFPPLVNQFLPLGGCLRVETLQLSVLEIFGNLGLRLLSLVKFDLAFPFILFGKFVPNAEFGFLLLLDTVLEVVNALSNSFSSRNLVCFSLLILKEWELRPSECLFSIVELLFCDLLCLLLIELSWMSLLILVEPVLSCLFFLQFSFEFHVLKYHTVLLDRLLTNLKCNLSFSFYLLLPGSNILRPPFLDLINLLRPCFIPGPFNGLFSASSLFACTGII